MNADGQSLIWDDLLDEAWERDCAIAARVCDPERDLGGYLAALWERHGVQLRGGLRVWVEPHPEEAAEVDDARWSEGSGSPGGRFLKILR